MEVVGVISEERKVGRWRVGCEARGWTVSIINRVSGGRRVSKGVWTASTLRLLVTYFGTVERRRRSRTGVMVGLCPGHG